MYQGQPLLLEVPLLWASIARIYTPSDPLSDTLSRTAYNWTHSAEDERRYYPCLVRTLNSLILKKTLRHRGQSSTYRSKRGSFIRRITKPRTVKKLNAHEATTAKLMSRLKPPPMTMKVIVRMAWRHMAFRGVLRVLLWRPNSFGRYPSLPAT